ncbi:uncharacterized protein [Aegilops tauschii subsp. strangulata]|uniref:uncharacterized protein isoform X2 n=1 Tax=Aegilops tauschii subsp. strangulata TaxID=200361 RepID=UPI000842E376|nr:uncharacterized protein LOC109763360 isoform X2 [Aegilops tauschii subsp. strangulata]
MDSPQKKLGSTMDGEMPHLLPVTTVSETVPKDTLAPPPEAVVIVSAYEFYPAFVVLLYYALHYAMISARSIFFLLTHAEAVAAEVSALDIGIVCCAVLQAAAAVLAVQLPCHRVWVSYAFAYLALALTIVGQCMFIDPGDAIFISAVGDLMCFLALLLSQR